MNEIIIVNTDKCVGCNACIRSCPAPEANITTKLNDGRFVTNVNPEKCIGCGECVRSCTHGARDFIDDTPEAMAAVRKREKVIVLATPSIKSVFPTKWKGILNWFREEGCLIYDVSFGADICTWAHLRAIQNQIVDSIITQPCAAIVRYIETYQPNLLKNLSPIHSPIMCAVIYIKQYLKQSHKILVLSPCVAKKYEFLETMQVDFNVTFKKLLGYFKEHGIRIPDDDGEDFAYDFEDEQGQLGAVYPRPGGLRDNLWMHDPEINITTSEGVHKVYPELDMYAALEDAKKPQVFDVLSCEFGCNVGAGTDTQQTVFDIMHTMREVEKEARQRRKITGGFFRGGEDRLFKRFDEELMLDDFIRKYKAVTISRTPSDRELNPIFESMGKVTDQDKQYNCHACGYPSCKAMATAIYRGLNTPENCIVYTKSLLYANNAQLTDQHGQLSGIAEQCKQLADKLNLNIDDILSSMGEISEANDATDNRATVVHDLLNNVIAFCNSTQQMDKNGLATLVQILETTVAAFDELDKNVKNTAENTAIVNQHITDMRQLVLDINHTLHAKNES
jgi:Na+-translocating ferredoxin:NAD+ oxidoreductase RNF subunit RnfB